MSTLVEIVVYLTLFSIFSVILARFGSDVRAHAMISEKTNIRLLRKQLLFDVMFRDLISASCHMSDWDEKNFVFKKKIICDGVCQSCDVGFKAIAVKDSSSEVITVYRYEGRYDFAQASWIKKSRSVLFRGVGQSGDAVCLSCSFDYAKKEGRCVAVTGIKIQLENNNWYIRIRNGVLGV